jgi:hypothetical protein
MHIWTDIDEIVNELNLARTEPAKYAKFLKEKVHYKKQYDMGGGR